MLRQGCAVSEGTITTGAASLHLFVQATQPGDQVLQAPSEDLPSAGLPSTLPLAAAHISDEPFTELQQQHPTSNAPASKHRPQSHHRQHHRHDLLQIQQQHKQQRSHSDCSAPRPKAKFQAAEGSLASKQMSSSDETTSGNGQLSRHAVPPLHQAAPGGLQHLHSQQSPQQSTEILQHQLLPQPVLPAPLSVQPQPQEAAARLNGGQAAAAPNPVAAAGLALSGLDPATLQHMAAWFAANADAQQQATPGAATTVLPPTLQHDRVSYHPECAHVITELLWSMRIWASGSPLAMFALF